MQKTEGACATVAANTKLNIVVYNEKKKQIIKNILNNNCCDCLFILL